MSAGDVRTIDKQGQWVNEVEGDPARSASFTSRDEAIDAGRAIARETGGRHLVEETEPTGDITDPDPASEPDATADRDPSTGMSGDV